MKFAFECNFEIFPYTFRFFEVELKAIFVRIMTPKREMHFFHTFFARRHLRFFEGIHKVCDQNVVKLLSKCAVCLSKMCKF